MVMYVKLKVHTGHPPRKGGRHVSSWRLSEDGGPEGQTSQPSRFLCAELYRDLAAKSEPVVLHV